ncbi:NAD(P)-dependent oxidoreductase [Cellulomonas xiejunii]|uniref:NAD(P)-dependent oxidoreductase n=1 Tax=Cellulomonas xiejunii TaxID=2968083 RepID=UPI001D0EC46B|nr:NAD(P)-dependent oxidoreductase [Cellulomonas xiejunii]MCC2314018.1 hypothetical protein [Cellulomonas xiejunii]
MRRPIPAGGRPRVVVVDPIDDHALSAMRDRYVVHVEERPGPARLIEILQDADAVVLRSGVVLDAETLRAAPRLKVIARAGSGTDNIDLVTARALGQRVVTVPAVSANAVAEHAIALLLAVARNIARADAEIRRDVWDKEGGIGRELRGSTLGVVGLGSIGTRVAQIGRALGMDVLATVARPGPERSANAAAAGVTLVHLDELLVACDAVVLAVPLTDRTRHLVGRRELAMMRSGAFLVNVSRGGVVDEQALLDALETRSIAGAGLDVFAAERTTTVFAGCRDAVLTPHLGAMTVEAQRRVGEVLVARLAEALQDSLEVVA